VTGSRREGDLLASWPLALRVAQSVAALHAGQVLAQVDKEERKHQRERIHGRRVRGRGGHGDDYFEPEAIQAVGDWLRAETRVAAPAVVGRPGGVEPRLFPAHGGAFPIRIRDVGVVGTVTVSRLPQADGHAFVTEMIGAFLSI
jgi:hypothetical protein